jgi:hypothetical protein
MIVTPEQLPVLLLRKSETATNPQRSMKIAISSLQDSRPKK